MTRASSAADEPSPHPSESPPAESWRSRIVRYVALAIIGVLAFYWFAQKTGGPEVGTPAANFDLPQSSSNERFNLASHRGTPVVVEVVASWCTTCEQSAPTLIRASQAKRAREVQFVAVSMDDSRAIARELKRSWHIPYPVLHDDGSFARQYNVSLLPTVILIDADGTIAHAKSGPPSAEQLEGWLSSVGAKAM